MEYTVNWEIQLDAESPEQAVREAISAFRDPDTLATTFWVEDEDGFEVEVNAECNGCHSRMGVYNNPGDSTFYCQMCFEIDNFDILDPRVP